MRGPICSTALTPEGPLDTVKILTQKDADLAIWKHTKEQGT